MRGKFINWFEVRKILKLGQSQHRIVAKGCVPITHSNRVGAFEFAITLDRPIRNYDKRTVLKLLPICGSHCHGIEGILVAFCGFDGGLAVYRRLGFFETAGYIFNGPRGVALRLYCDYDGSCSNYAELLSKIRPDFEDWPPFKLI